MSQYKQVRRELADAMADDKLPCRFCNAMTPRDALSALGARCQQCYHAYCAEPVSERANVKRLDPEPIWFHAWAYRLRARKASGLRLSPAQAHCLAEFDKRIA